jgi:hypothetical protein
MQVQRDARRWLTVPSPDLSWVLTMVGVDPGFWFSHALPELREQWRVLDDARDLGLRRRRGAGVAPWAAEAQALALG